jgi:bisphosphoglycerate-independent phosphoglycerate mutase (AlkP superfamily)
MSNSLYSLYGAGAAMVFIAIGGAYNAMDRSANWKQAQAAVSYIDRNCKIVQTTYDGNYNRVGSETVTEACNTAEDWDKVKTKRTKVADGKAVVHVTYVAPQNGQYQNGELTFDGRDDEFYELKAGDQVAILVSNSDPTKIRKA